MYEKKSLHEIFWFKSSYKEWMILGVWNLIKSREQILFVLLPD